MKITSYACQISLVIFLALPFICDAVQSSDVQDSQSAFIAIVKNSQSEMVLTLKQSLAEQARMKQNGLFALENAEHVGLIELKNAQQKSSDELRSAEQKGFDELRSAEQKGFDGLRSVEQKGFDGLRSAEQKGFDGLRSAEQKARSELGMAAQTARSELGMASQKARSELGMASQTARSELGMASQKARSELGMASQKARSVLNRAGVKSNAWFEQVHTALEYLSSPSNCGSTAIDKPDYIQQAETSTIWLLKDYFVTEGISFENACQAHDKCYEDCKASKSQCDSNLYRDAVSTCNNTLFGIDSTKDCMTLAMTVYIGVSNSLATAAFNNAQMNCSKNLGSTSTSKKVSWLEQTVLNIGDWLIPSPSTNKSVASNTDLKNIETAAFSQNTIPPFKPTFLLYNVQVLNTELAAATSGLQDPPIIPESWAVSHADQAIDLLKQIGILRNKNGDRPNIQPDNIHLYKELIDNYKNSQY